MWKCRQPLSPGRSRCVEGSMVRRGGYGIRLARPRGRNRTKSSYSPKFICAPPRLVHTRAHGHHPREQRAVPAHERNRCAGQRLTGGRVAEISATDTPTRSPVVVPAGTDQTVTGGARAWPGCRHRRPATGRLGSANGAVVSRARSASAWLAASAGVALSSHTVQSPDTATWVRSPAAPGLPGSACP